MEIGVADVDAIQAVPKMSGIVEVGDVEGRSRDIATSGKVEEMIEKDEEGMIEELVEQTAKVSV